MTMKKNYIAPPRVKVVDIQQTENVMATSVTHTPNPADRLFGTDIKGERNFDITFTEIGGQEIVRNNPWDNEW